MDSAPARHVHVDERPIGVAGEVWSRDVELPTGQQSRLADRDSHLARSGAIARRDSPPRQHSSLECGPPAPDTWAQPDLALGAAVWFPGGTLIGGRSLGSGAEGR